MSSSGYRSCGCGSSNSSVTVEEYLLRRRVVYTSQPSYYDSRPVRKSISDYSLSSPSASSLPPIGMNSTMNNSCLNVSSAATPYNSPYRSPKSNSSFLSIPSGGGGGCCGGNRSRSTSSLADDYYNTSLDRSSLNRSLGTSRRSDTSYRSGGCGCG